MSSTVHPRNENFDSIQILRGVAALLVVIWHSHLATKGFLNNYWIEGHNQNYFCGLNYLYIGVDIFFCISGFIMSMILDRGGEWKQFVLSRFVRIYPPYWFFSLLVLFAYLINPSFNLGGFSTDSLVNIKKVLFSMLLLPQEHGPMLPVGWTLVYEVLFYGCCATLLFFRKQKYLIPCLGVLYCIALLQNLFGFSLAYGTIFPAYEIEFLLGAVIYIYRGITPNIYPNLQLIAAPTLYCLICLSFDHHRGLSENDFLRTLGFGCVAFLLINGTIGIEKSLSAASPFLFRAFKQLGDSSYVLYLSHWLVLSGLSKVGAHFSSLPLSLVIVWHIASIGSAIAFAVIVSRFVEMPFHDFMKAKLSSAISAPKVAVTSCK